MGNHIHLLLREEKEPLEQIFKRIGARYVYWYNWKYKRSGHLFQDRFKSEPIKNDAHFLAVLRYIYQNPVKANICREPGKYRWSSYRSLGTDLPPVDGDRLLEYLPLEQLRAFVETQTEDRFLDLEPDLRITDQEAAEMAKGIIKTKRLSGIHMLPPAEQAAGIKSLHEKGCSIRQLARLTGISKGRIEGMLK